MVRRYLYIITIFSLFVACEGGAGVALSSQDHDYMEDGDMVAANFTLAMGDYVQTRSTKLSWSTGDEIFIGYENDDMLEEPSTYYITGDGTLEPKTDSDRVYYIFNNTNTYHAIYPYTATSIEREEIMDDDKLAKNYDYYYIADLSDQTGESSAIDLLYAINTIESQDSDTDVELDFHHQYALVTLDLTHLTQNDYSSVTLRGAYAKARFNILSGLFDEYQVSDISLSPSSSIEVLMLPWQNMSDISLVVSYSDGKVELATLDIVDGGDNVVVLEPNHQYKFTL